MTRGCDRLSARPSIPQDNDNCVERNRDKIINWIAIALVIDDMDWVVDYLERHPEITDDE